MNIKSNPIILLLFYCEGLGIPSKAGKHRLKSLSHIKPKEILFNHFNIEAVKQSLRSSIEKLGHKLDGLYIDLNDSCEFLDIWLNLGVNDDLEIFTSSDLDDLKNILIKEASNDRFVSCDGMDMDLFDSIGNTKRNQKKFNETIEKLKGKLNG